MTADAAVVDGTASKVFRVASIALPAYMGKTPEELIVEWLNL